MSSSINASSAYKNYAYQSKLNNMSTLLNASKSSLTNKSSLSSLRGSSGISASDYNQVGSLVSSTKNYGAKNSANLIALKKAADSLNRVASTLTTSQSLTSSDSSVASSDATFYSGGTSRSSGSYTVSVSQLASAQTSISAALDSTDASSFSVGQNSLKINVGDKTTAVSFNISSADTNSTAFSKLAKSINASGAGVTASVTTKDGKSSLSVVSNNTGTTNSFSIVSGSGSNTASVLSMSVSAEAKDAKYSVNGKDYTAASNDTTLPYGAGSLKLSGTGTATLSRTTDTDDLISAASSFVSAYNTAVSYLGGSSGTGTSKALGLITDSGLSRLSSIGISMTTDGTLSLDSDKLSAAASNSPATVKSYLSGANSTISDVRDGASEAMSLPTASYTNFTNMKVSSDLINALMPTTGTFLDLFM